MLIFVATNLQSGTKPSLLDSIGDAPVRGELWYSPAPDSAIFLFRASAKGGERLVLHGEVSHPGIIGAEYRVNAHGLAGGRSRFGIQDIQSLASLPAGTCELSVPMLVDASALSTTGAVPLERALLGGLTLQNPIQLGVAWESYGVIPGDTTTVAVHIERIVDIGRLRRAAIVIDVVNDPSVSGGCRWTEPDPSRGSVTLNASVPVTQRHLTIGVNALKAGAYLLQIEMQNAHCGTIRSELRLNIER